MQLSLFPAQLDYQPTEVTDFHPGIGIVGCGQIVRNAHLPAYEKLGLRVVGVYDIAQEAIDLARSQFAIERVYASLDDLLDDPEISIVDIATHPAQRIELMQRAIDAGKHILAQKPLALDIAAAQTVINAARKRNLKIAVNQNGRWAPPWRAATLLVEQGIIGQVLSVTHLLDVSFAWVTGTKFDDIPHWVIYDYSVHWFDIIRCWMGDEEVEQIRARDFRIPIQPESSKTPWGMLAEMTYANGAHATIQTVGGASAHAGGHPFWIHGTQGVIRGSVLGGDYLELETKQGVYRYTLKGQWFPDGFAGTMAELIHAIKEDREAYNSAEHNIRSLQMTLAACLSADEGGRPVTLQEVQS